MSDELVLTVARRSFETGARMIHVHARWDDGAPTQEASRYRETVAAIRQEAPEIIVQVSTGGAIGMTAAERLGSLAAGPDMASLTCGTVNFGRGATGIGRNHLPVIMTAIAAGGHVRLGFEDQVEYEPGRLAASNAELVERAARIGELAGRPVTTPARAREILRLAA